MQATEAGRLLNAWERGQTQHPLHRALTVLQAVDPSQTVDDLASLTIGERDRRLFRLRERLFGSRLEAVASCSRCGERLDLNFYLDQLPVAADVSATAELQVEGRSYSVRLPNTIDLLEAASELPERRVSVLLERCAGAALPDAVATAIQSHMAEMDPLTSLELKLSCPVCEHRWTESFDIASYLWTELKDYALRLLRETHVLASAYGWSEADIHGMNPRRRRIYLDFVADDVSGKPHTKNAR